jgi:glycine betaine/proline transport system ATP-binding protein
MVSDQPRLSCAHLWKVYGGPHRAASSIGGGGETSEIAADLRRQGAVVAVANVSFDVAAGEIFVIMGLSGSGKSTVVRCLSRLIEPTAGEIRFDGVNLLSLKESELVDLRRHKMGMVFQHFGLFPHMTVLENVAYPLRVQGLQPAERNLRAKEMIELVGLAGREQSYPRELSGGMQQRVGIARSLSIKPLIWFLDEPFSALDPLIRRQMQDEFLQLQEKLQTTIVFITHDFLEALKVADRIAIMRDGEIVQIGSPTELVLKPADGYVADFTRDVPREKVITAADVMRPTSRTGAEGCILTTDLIEKVIPRLVGRRAALPVCTPGGVVVGEILADDVLAVLSVEGSGHER